MRYFSGHDGPEARLLGITHHLGFMNGPNAYGPEVCRYYRAFALDNGCFSDDWRESAWLGWLERQPPGAMFAVCPDVVADPVTTLERWHRYAPTMRARGLKVAYVLQDGQRAHLVPSDADYLFVGGSTEWKLSHHALRLVQDSRIPAQMGRVNSERRLRRAVEMGCVSVDGTFLAFGPKKNAPQLAAWLDRLGRTAGTQLAWC